MNKIQIINYLSKFFLKFQDPDEGFLKTSQFICRLNRCDIKISDIQYKAYKCKK